jgi:predicted DNA-binding transcriptional regulator AlpA
MTQPSSATELVSLGDLLAPIVTAAIADAHAQYGERTYITVDEVARMLSISARSVRRRWYDGTIPPPERFGRSIRWRRLDIENMKGAYCGEYLSA